MIADWKQTIRRAGRHGAWAWRVALFVALPGLAIAQDASLPYFPVETVHADGVRNIEVVISRGGWHLIGRDPEGYRIGMGKTDGMTGNSAAALQTCNKAALLGHGSLERTIPAQDYAGGRVRVTGRLKHNGAGFSNFYFNVLGPGGRHIRQIKTESTQRGDWETDVIVADVPQEAIALDIGLALWGSNASTLWLDSVIIEAVDKTVPLSGDITPNGYVRPPDEDVVSCDGFKDGIRG